MALVVGPDLLFVELALGLVLGPLPSISLRDHLLSSSFQIVARC